MLLQAPIVGIVTPVWLKVVDIGTLSVDDIAEETLLRHIERCKFEVVVATILQYHAVYTVAFSSIYQLPALLDGICRWNLDGYMLTMLHSIYPPQQNKYTKESNHTLHISSIWFLTTKIDIIISSKQSIII